MDPSSSPFASLTFIVAPALLTNASSLLALSTVNRLLRTRDSMHELFNKYERVQATGKDADRVVAHAGRLERQATLILRGIRAVYVALAAFACATLVTLLGASFGDVPGARLLAGLGIALGGLGVGGLVLACFTLFRATQLSLVSIREEAEIIRARQLGRAASEAAGPPGVP